MLRGVLTKSECAMLAAIYADAAHVRRRLSCMRTGTQRGITDSGSERGARILRSARIPASRTSPQTNVWSDEAANRQPMRAIAYCRNLPVVASGFGTLQAYYTSRGGDPEYSTEFSASAAIATGRGGLLKFEAACNLLLRSGLRVPAVVSLESVSVARGRRIASALRAELSGLAGFRGTILVRTLRSRETDISRACLNPR